MAGRRRPRTWQAMLSGLVSERGIGVEQNIAYGPHVRHLLDVYHGHEARKQSPIVLFFYGGGWTSGDRAIYAFVGGALAAKGITTAIADYRLYPDVRFPAFCEDAARAYAWVRSHLAEDGRRPLVVMGHSAGAHIAALLAFDPVHRTGIAPGLGPPSALIGLSGPYDFDPTTWPTTSAIFATAPTADVVRPVVLALSGGPATLLIHGAADETVHPVAVDMLAGSLQASGTPVTRYIYPRIGHVGLITAFAQPLRWRAPLLGDVVKFLDGL